MKKTNKVLGVLTAVAVVIGFAVQAGAFCVHNYADTKMNFVETTGGSTFGRFASTVDPGQSACCNWADSGCNTSGNKTASLTFQVQWNYDLTSGGWLRTACSGVTIPACSDLDVTGTSGNYQCVAHGTETCN